MTSSLKITLPNEWNFVKIKDISKRFIGGGTPSTKNKEYWNGNIPWMTSAILVNMYINEGMRNISEIGLMNSSSHLVPKESIIISTRVGIGKVSIAGIDIAINQDLTGIIIDQDKALPEYIYWILSNSRNKLFNLSQGTTVRGIERESLENLKVLLPSIKEQYKINSILSNVNSLIINTQKIIESLQILIKGLMHRLFSEGIGHTEFKETRLGKTPKEWEIKKLGDLINIYDSERIPLSKAERNERKGNYPYCGATGIIDYIDDYLFDGEYVLLAEDGGPFGKFESSAYIMSGTFWVNNHAHVIQAIHGQTTNLYLLYVLNYLSLIPYIVGSTRQKLNQGDLKKIKIPVPNLEEQESIVKILSNLDKKTEYEKLLKKILKKIKTGLMQELLTGKKRVKIN